MIVVCRGLVLVVGLLDDVLFVVGCLCMRFVCCLLFVVVSACGVLFDACCLLFGACPSACVVCCLLGVVC